jgi:hypothetical protein
MIEARNRPRIRRMAIFALLAVASAVAVFDTVASDAFGRCADKRSILVTVATSGIGVFSD